MKLLRKLLLFGLFVFSSLFLQLCNYRCKGGNSTQTRVIDSFSFSEPFLNKSTRGFIARDSIGMNSNDTLHFEMLAATHLVDNTPRNSEALYACDISVTYNFIDFDSIAIFTEVDFDQQHKSGTRVDAFFRVSGYGLTSPIFPINQYAQYRNKDRDSYGNFTLSLIQKPSSNLLKLRVHFFHSKLSDGISIQSPTYTFKH